MGHAGRRKRSRQRERQLAAREPDAGEIAAIRGLGISLRIWHSDRHGRAILPDSLRRLWRDYKSLSPALGPGECERKAGGKRGADKTEHFRFVRPSFFRPLQVASAQFDREFAA
jgi:hypothetical protein